MLTTKADRKAIVILLLVIILQAVVYTALSIYEQKRNTTDVVEREIPNGYPYKKIQNTR